MFLLAFVLFVAACGANEGILKSGKADPSSTNAGPVLTTVEKDIGDMQTADFRFIYVLRRKDGGSIDAEDRGIIKLQTVDVNRRISSDNGKAFVVGSNTQIPAARMAALFDRFAVENYSPPPEVDSNSDVNANK